MTYWLWNELGTCSMLESNTEEGVVIVDVRDLLDGSGNSVDKVAEKIMLVGNLLCSGQRVIVRCRAGMSRSNTIACAAMMWITTDYTWDSAWAKVRSVCPRASLNLDFYETVKEALIKLNGNYGAVKMKDRLEINHPISKDENCAIMVINRSCEKEKKELVMKILKENSLGQGLTISEIVEKSNNFVTECEVKKIINREIMKIYEPHVGRYKFTGELN